MPRLGSALPSLLPGPPALCRPWLCARLLHTQPAARAPEHTSRACLSSAERSDKTLPFLAQSCTWHAEVPRHGQHPARATAEGKRGTCRNPTSSPKISAPGLTTHMDLKAVERNSEERPCEGADLTFPTGNWSRRSWGRACALPRTQAPYPALLQGRPAGRPVSSEARHHMAGDGTIC